MAIAGALALAACASGSKQTKEDPKEQQSQLICTWERSIGSNIPEKICREPEDPQEPPKTSVQPTPAGQGGR
jgi:hypothetical protein